MDKETDNSEAPKRIELGKDKCFEFRMWFYVILASVMEYAIFPILVIVTGSAPIHVPAFLFLFLFPFLPPLSWLCLQNIRRCHLSHSLKV